MLSLLLIYYIGKTFYDLANLHGKNKWLYALTGILVTYFGIFIGGLIIGLVYEFLERPIEAIPDILLGLLGLPFGLFVWWLFFSFLDRKWSAIPVNHSNELLDDDLMK